jgi:hypothetical protein
MDEIEIECTGDVVCYKVGVKLLDVHDATFPGPGKIGLWSKSDAQTEFDELKLQGL